MTDVVHIEEQPLVVVVDGFIPVPGPQGVPGTAIQGTLDDPSELPEIGHPGDAWLIDNDLWLWTGDPPAWVNAGPFPVGPPGPTGPTGATGPQGPPGADSTVPGPQGP